MDNPYDVIIIGCGISAIGASMILSKNHIRHIMLESRDRIGGRIHTQQLQGVGLDMGAMLVHHPNENNPIKTIMDKIGWKSINKRYDSKQIMMDNGTGIDLQVKKRGYKVYKEILEELEAIAFKSEKDISITEAMSVPLQEKTLTEKGEVMAFVRLLLRIHGNIEGAELDQISAKDLYVDDPSDVLPQHGYAKLLQTIFNFDQREVRFNTEVVSIDYGKEIIQVITKNGVFYGRKVICSLPLGVLKNGSVQFQPQLPENKVKAIDNMGVGVFNKVQVCFSAPFWDTSKQYLLLVSNDEPFFRIRAFHEGGRYILCAYVSGEDSRKLSSLTDPEIIQKFVSCLKKFYPNGKIDPTGSLITRWHTDPHSLGSYSFFPAGKASVDEVFELSTSIQGKIWLIGEHCAPEFTGCAHGAFRSGIEAAKQASTLILGNHFEPSPSPFEQ